MPELDADVGAYYDRGGEATRLDGTLIARTEREPAIVGATSHLLATGR